MPVWAARWMPSWRLRIATVLPVVEDNAHGLFAKYKGRKLGTFGVLATQSFHETKNISCGEGGALLINDDRYIERAEIIREKGTNRSRFFRGQVDKYTWVDIGSSYLPSELLAAVLWAQLETARGNSITSAGRSGSYNNELADWAQRMVYGCLLSPTIANSRITCSTCLCRTWKYARGSSQT